MPNHSENIHEQRILAGWKTQACAAGWCAGVQIFLSGCAVGIPLALNGAWIAALAALPFCAWLTVRCRRCLLREAGFDPLTRAGYLLLALSLLGSGAFASASLVGFAAQTLAQQARPIWTEAAALAAVLLCSLSGSTGAARLCYALRYAVPALVLGLSLTAVPLRVPAGLFPLLGTGALPLGMAAAGMLFSAAPVLMLLLPPEPLTGRQADRPRVIPDTRFLFLRVLAGASAGALLVFLTSAFTTYESIAQSITWGARLRMAAGNQPHEGVLEMLLMLTKLTAMLMLSVNMLCAAQQALELAMPMLRKRRMGFFTAGILLCGILAVPAVYGDAPLLTAAPLLSLGAVASVWILGRRRSG